MATPSTPSKRRKPTSTGTSTSGASKNSDTMRKSYLFAFNLVSCLAWFYCLERVVRHMSAGTSQFTLVPGAFRSTYSDVVTRATTMHADIGFNVKWVQTIALLEVVHVLLGLVRSSLATTGMQVASRIWMVWGVLGWFPEVTASPFYASMVFAWSFTEVIRYAHYAAGLADIKIDILEWLRYSTFYVLYPIGAGSEALVMYASAQFARAKFGEVGMLVMGTLILVWPPGLAVMMSHMHKQRRKNLGGGKKFNKKRA